MSDRTHHPVDDALADLIEAMSAVADPVRAPQMRAYMKDRFEFLGVGAPQRRRVARPFMAAMKGADRDELLVAAEQLWVMGQREYVYVGADLLRANARRLTPDVLGRLGALVRTDPWWDGVDPLAKVVGDIVRAHPGAADRMDRWVEDPDLWIVRVAIIHQVGWKREADPERIFRYCAAQAGHPDVFVRKAIGWALRDLARSYPDEVREFVESHREPAGARPALSALSVREATKHL